MPPTGHQQTGATVQTKRISLTLVTALAVGAAVANIAVRPAQSSAAGLAAANESAAITAFYRSRGGAPLWFSPRSGAAAQQLVQLLATASADNLDPRRYNTRNLARAVQAASRGDRN